MQDALRSLLLLALAGCIVTVAGSGAAWWLDEERRIRRFLRRALGGPPEAVIIARGRGRAAALNVERALVAVLWDGGVKGLIYRLRQLVGAELIIDDHVAGRAFRGEPRRPLEQTAPSAHRVALRLIFDNPRDPDFELELWPPADLSQRERASVAEAITASRRWLSGVEAILRQTTPEGGQAFPPAPVASPPEAPAVEEDEPELDLEHGDSPPWLADDEEEEED